MRKTLALFLTIILTAFFLPYGISGIMSISGRQAVATISSGDGDAVTAGKFTDPFMLSVYITSEGRVIEVEFEEYLCGILAGEMPPTYHIEALKAQAVAARSYILSKVADHMDGKIPEEHNGAMVCTNYAHCKAWKSLSDAKVGWDARFADDYEAKIKQAVSQTFGEYMVYDGKVVKAYFYAISSGRTENVSEVWGSNLPYLKSVVSQEDIGADGYESLSSYPKDIFVQKLKKEFSEIEINDPKTMVGEIKRTEGGSVSTIELGGISIEGKKLRDIFDLRSANFEILTDGDKITFKVKGYGHGVGMSQNGANTLAIAGKDYREILKHYYSGVSLTTLY